jgi:hypothetical protein
LFIVVLVIMALTGVAMFAAKSASTDVAIAGGYRQAAQTRYIAQLGMQTACSELARDPQTYLRAMNPLTPLGGSAPVCDNAVPATYTAGSYASPATPPTPNPRGYNSTPIDTGGCFVFGYAGMQASVGAGNPLVQAASGTTPSGLGTSNVLPDFHVEMTDKDTWDAPISGFGAGSGVNMKFYTVTLTGDGLIVPPGAAGSSLSYRASREELRAQVTVGPLPEGL